MSGARALALENVAHFDLGQHEGRALTKEKDTHADNGFHRRSSHHFRGHHRHRLDRNHHHHHHHNIFRQTNLKCML